MQVLVAQFLVELWDIVIPFCLEVVASYRVSKVVLGHQITGLGASSVCSGEPQFSVSESQLATLLVHYITA